MSNVVQCTYTFTNSTASSHFSKSGGMHLGQAGLVSNPLILWQSNSGTATMNNTGKSFLYPKAGIHPFKADHRFYLWNATDSDFTSNPSSYMNFYFKIDGVEVYHKEVAPGKVSNVTYDHDEITNSTNSAILNSTSSSSITFEITAQKNGFTQMCGVSSRDEGVQVDDFDSFIKFYFQQWDLLAQRTGNGDSLLFSPGRIYDGESVTFTAMVHENSTWHGWYSDSAHTQLLSTSLTYTIEASQDLTIYGYSTKNNKLYDDLYYKGEVKNCERNAGLSPIYDQVSKYYIKTSNGWVLQSTKSTIDKTKNYFNKKLYPSYRTLSELSETTNYNRSKIRNYPLLYNFIDQENYYIHDISQFGYDPISNFIIPNQKGFWIHSKKSASTTISISYFSSSDFELIEKLFVLNEPDGANTAYIQIKEGNNISKVSFTAISGYTVPNQTPSGTSITGLREVYSGIQTGRVLSVGQTYYDVCDKETLWYEPVTS